MNRNFPLPLLASLLLLLAGHGLNAAEATIEVIQKDGKLEHDLKTGKTVATEGVLVKLHDPERGEMELSANRISLDQESGELLAEGLVSFRREGQIWRGERLQYNYRTRQLSGSEFKTGKTPFYVAGMALAADRTNQVYAAAGAYVTTDDVSEPGYRVRAKTLIIVPGQSIEARHATFYFGQVPVFYWPFFHRSLVRHPNNLELTPGFRSLYGAYLLGSYNWFVSTNLGGTVHLDYRQKRGLGLGPDVKYDLGEWGRGEFKGYYLWDDKPGTNLLGAPIERERHRISFTHQVTLRTNLTAQIVVREQGDTYVVRDFFESEYRQNIQPKSFLEVEQLWPNFSLNFLAQPRINDFYETVERLPEIKFTGLRQQIGVSPLYYESESTLGYYKHEFAGNILPDFAAWRGDTYHQVLLPLNFFGWLNFTPRVGGRFTHYSEAEGQGAATTTQNRRVLNTGAELSFKAARTWDNAKSRFWDVDGLRHIIEPSINYVFVPRPNVVPAQLPQFDYELPSLRLLPIEYPDYNAIDAMDSQNVFRFGLHNKVQTKRAGDLANLLNWEVYTDWRVKPRAGQSTFADIYSDLDLQPRPWLTLTSETRYDIASGEFRLADHRATISPGSTWAWAIGHRYFRNDPVLGANSGNNLIVSSLYYRVNENWGLRATQHFEARDGVMEEQFYTLYRDFRSWTGALTTRLRENRAGGQDFTIAFTFSLKAFPRYRLGHDVDTPSLLLGY